MEKKEIGKRLKELRSQLGISSRNMSSALGQSLSYISNIERGYMAPSMEMFFLICEYLHVTPAEFFHQIDEQNRGADEAIKRILRGYYEYRWKDTAWMESECSEYAQVAQKAGQLEEEVKKIMDGSEELYQKFCELMSSLNQKQRLLCRESYICGMLEAIELKERGKRG